MSAHILIVEDNPGDVELLRMAFRRAQLECELMVIGDGQKALAYVQRRAGRESGSMPDLTILDLNIPKNDGLEILEAIRASDEFQGVPVVVLTSSGSPRDAARVQELGATRHLIKPMDLEGFMEVGKIVKGVLEEAPTRPLPG